MPLIAKTNMQGSGTKTVTETTLNGTDTLVYNASGREVLILRNPTGGAISPVIDGNGGTTVPVQGVGNVDVSAGFAVGSIPAGQARAIPLDTISAFLQGTVSVNTGTGLVASLLSYA